MAVASPRTFNEQHNAIRMCLIILDIGAKVIREHIEHYLIEKNGFGDVNQLINNRSIVSEEMFRRLKKGCFRNIPASLDSFDITKSFALIHNVINELHKEKIFNYDDKKYDYCLQLKEIRNEKFAHFLAFQMEDVEFSVTVVTIQEIIRQLCDFDSKLMQDYLDKIEVELNKDNSEINNLKNDVITLLLEQKEELQKLITSLSDSTDSKIRSFGQDLKAFISTEVVQSQNDTFIQLMDEMKKHEESRRLMFEVFLEQTVMLKEIKSDTTYIKSGIAEIKESIEKQHKPGVSEIGLASNLPARPQTSQLYKRDNEDEIFEKIAKHKHKLSCIAGMAGVGKSTLAITYCYHRIDNHKAKVNI
jgi:hypothetical protein